MVSREIDNLDIRIGDNLRSAREIDNLDIRIGDNLRSAREFNKLTQTEVGYILNVSPQQIAKYETGKNRISASNLYRLAKMLL